MDRDVCSRETVVLVRCGTCGTFMPRKIGYGAKVVSLPCAHRDWQEVRYVPESASGAGIPESTGDGLARKRPSGSDRSVPPRTCGHLFVVAATCPECARFLAELRSVGAEGGH